MFIISNPLEEQILDGRENIGTSLSRKVFLSSLKCSFWGVV